MLGKPTGLRLNSLKQPRHHGLRGGNPLQKRAAHERRTRRDEERNAADDDDAMIDDSDIAASTPEQLAAFKGFR